MITRKFANFLKQQRSSKEKGRRDDSGSFSSKIQCFECKGFGNIRADCANFQKQKKKRNNQSDSDTDSDFGEKLRNFIALTTLDFNSENMYAA